jgi:hypothetical protein
LSQYDHSFVTVAPGNGFVLASGHQTSLPAGDLYHCGHDNFGLEAVCGNLFRLYAAPRKTSLEDFGESELLMTVYYLEVADPPDDDQLERRNAYSALVRHHENGLVLLVAQSPAQFVSDRHLSATLASSPLL